MPPRPGVVSRRDAVLAGHHGDSRALREMLAHSDADVRSAALGGLARCGELGLDDLVSAGADPAAIVRRRAAGLLADATSSPGLDGLVESALRDPDPTVREVACFAAGERAGLAPALVAVLCEIATTDDDPLCRESAVAALGSLGDELGREAVLSACTDRATVRRRAVLALVAFDGDDVSAMLEAMAGDSDWQVRQAAEELLAIE